MASYIHHVPGRLRVKTTALKGDLSLARRAQDHLEASDGVHSVSVNTLTGSIIINYDVRVQDGDTLLTVLEEEGFIFQAPVEVKRVQPTGQIARRVGTTGESVSNLIIGVVAEKLIERSATALLAAIL